MHINAFVFIFENLFTLAAIARQRGVQLLPVASLEEQTLRQIRAEYILRQRKTDRTASAAAIREPAAGGAFFVVCCQIFYRRANSAKIIALAQVFLQTVGFHIAEKPVVLFVIAG